MSRFVQNAFDLHTRTGAGGARWYDDVELPFRRKHHACGTIGDSDFRKARLIEGKVLAEDGDPAAFDRLARPDGGHA
jgi:hypothetical protein